MDSKLAIFLQNCNSKNTKKAYESDILELQQFLRAKNLDLVTLEKVDTLIEYRNMLLSNGKAPGTIARKIASIKSFLNWLVEVGHLEKNPAIHIKSPKPVVLEPTLAFTDREVTAMLQKPDLSSFYGNLHYIILILLFNLGLRRSELSNLKWGDLYEDRGQVALKVLGKGQKLRILPLNTNIYAYLQKYKSYYEKTCNMTLIASDYILQTRKIRKNIKPMDCSSINEVVIKYARAAGITRRVSAHSCRATMISHLLDTQHLPIRDVADAVGHSSVNTTILYDKKRKGLSDSALLKVNYE